MSTSTRGARRGGRRMKLPKSSKKFYIQGECPDCGYRHYAAWEATHVDGNPNLLTRRCLCPECGCWFQETLRLDLQTADITQTGKSGEEETERIAHHIADCPQCGKPLEKADSPYFGDEEEEEYEETKDVEDWVHPRLWYCLDCHLDVRETYQIVRIGTKVIRHGLGPKDSERCPECGSMSANYTLRQNKPSTFTLFCECRDCGCRYQLATEETYNQSRVNVVDRDSWYADEDYESTYFETIVKVGDQCPMCEAGVIAVSEGFVDGAHNPRRGLRGTRTVFYECLNCGTEYEDLYDTRVLGVRVIEKGKRG